MSEQVSMTPTELNDLVCSTAKAAHTFIIKQIKDAQEMDERSRWLLQCRIVNFIFSRHYEFITREAQTKISEMEHGV